MAKTITMHIGHTYSFAHDFDKEFRAKEAHIDPSLSERNIILKQPETLKEAYEKVFGEALEKYNLQQVEKGHTERQIENYLNHVKNDAKKHECYEMIAQIGDRNDTGIFSDDERHIDALKDFFNCFLEENKNIYVLGAIIHRDEFMGTDHLQMLYFPVAYGLTRGLEVQNSLNKALEQEGFKTERGKGTELMQWTQKQRDLLERSCREHNIEVEHKRETREHMEKEVYIQYSKGEELKRENKELEQDLQLKRDVDKTLDRDISKKREELDKISKKPFREPEIKKFLGKEYYLREDVQNYLQQVKARDLERQSELDKTTQQRDVFGQALAKEAEEKDRIQARLTHLQEKQWDREYLQQQQKEIERVERAEREHQHNHNRNHEKDVEMER